MVKKLAPIHPGEVLREEFMVPENLSANRLALALEIPTSRVSEILHGRRSITADTALRLGRYFETSARLWMNLQAKYDLDTANDAGGKEIERKVHPRKEAMYA
jgi:addiction module HigA family antidote